jgi:probable rRNA maturation factor
MIEVNNLTAYSVDEEFLKKMAKKILEEEKKKRAQISIALVGPARIRKLNKKYRGENRVTDVLAFPNPEFFFKKMKQVLPSEHQNLGEIVICLREVKKSAKRFQSKFEKELILCLIHGILHLLGYNHEKSQAKAKKMEERQNYYLSKALKL